jgi:hypothetical protein
MTNLLRGKEYEWKKPGGLSRRVTEEGANY